MPIELQRIEVHMNRLIQLLLSFSFVIIIGCSSSTNESAGIDNGKSLEQGNPRLARDMHLLQLFSLELKDLEKEKKGAPNKAVGIAATTAPPDSSSFVKQAEKVKHAILQSLGEFLTGAFADDEELSGSYFSQDLLDQISANDPTVKGIWLQAKSLNDAHVKQLCEGLIRNKVVTEVWLPANQITDEGAGYIAHMLKFNHSIKELFLGKNEIGPKVSSQSCAHTQPPKTY